MDLLIICSIAIIIKLKYIRYNITMGLFWVAPDEYLNLDQVNRNYLANLAYKMFSKVA